MSNTVAHAPLVVVSYSQDGEHAPQSFRDAMVEAGDRIRDELIARGVRVRIANAAHPELPAERAMEGADGVMVLGGADIDPAAYRQELQADNLYYVDRAADDYEIALVQTAVERELPVFGICRGAQVINVALGGTLIQDLGEGFHNKTVLDDPWANHDVSLAGDTRLAGLLGVEQVDVRTGHHQAVDVLGEGLRPAAVAADGVVEAVEGTEQWIVGVQWHPEEGAADADALGKLLDGYVQQLRRRA